MPWGAVAAAVVGGVMANNAADKGADAQKDAQGRSIAEQRRQYDLTRGDLKPYMDWGASAIPGLQRVMAGDYSGFESSPDYLWTTQQGIGQLDASAASRGNLFGGGHQKDLVQFNQGNASNFLNNYINRLTNQAAAGQNAAAGLGGIGQNTANAISNAYGIQGNAASNAAYQQGQNYMGMAAAGGNAFGQWYGNNKANNPGGTGWYFGNNPGPG